MMSGENMPVMVGQVREWYGENVSFQHSFTIQRVDLNTGKVDVYGNCCSPEKDRTHQHGITELLAETRVLRDLMPRMSPPDPLADVDWSGYLPLLIQGPENGHEFRVNDVWRIGLADPKYTGVYRVTEVGENRVHFDVLAGVVLNRTGSYMGGDSEVDKCSRLIARDGKLVAKAATLKCYLCEREAMDCRQEQERPSAMCWESEHAKYCHYGKAKSAEAAKVEVRAKVTTCYDCKAPALVGYKGMCWPCTDRTERKLGAPAELPQPEPLRMTGYDNSVAGIGVVPGIWRVHAKAGR